MLPRAVGSSRRGRVSWLSPALARLVSALAALLLVTSPFVTAAAQAAAPANAPADDLRTTLNRLGQEHVYLAGAALSAAIAGRQDEYKVAGDAVDQNSQELAKAVGSVYGPEAERTFLALWRAHIGMCADYATGAATNDNAKKQKAMSDLQGYRRDIGAFFAGANPNLPAQTVADLFGPHVTHLTGTIDALAAGDAPKGYMMLHDAAHQTKDIMDPLAGAIAKQFPDKFPMGAAQAAPPAAPAAQQAAPAPKPTGQAPAAQPPAPAPKPTGAQPPMQMPSGLPNTGQASAPVLPVLVSALLGLALISGGWVLHRSRR